MVIASQKARNFSAKSLACKAERKVVLSCRKIDSFSSQVYIGECAERSWRAALLCFAYISYYTGQIIVYAVHEKWNQSHFARFHLMSALLATAVLFLSPESPVW